MADFYKARQQGGWLPIIMETPDAIVIEGVSHDKATLNPQFLSNLEYNNVNNAMPSLFNRFWIKWSTHASYWRSWHCDPSSVKFDGGQGIVKSFKYSDYNSDEVYIVAGQSNGRVLKVNRATNEILNDVTNTYGGPWVAGYPYFQGQVMFNETSSKIDMLVQDDNIYGNNYAGYYCFSLYSNTAFLTSVSKAGWAYEGASVYLGGAVQPQVVFQDAVYTYLSSNGYLNNQNSANSGAHYVDTNNSVYGKHVLWVKERSTGVMTEIVNTAGLAWNITPGPSAARMDNPADPLNPWMHYWCAFPDTAANFYQFKRIRVNTSNPVTTEKQSASIVYGGAFVQGTTMKGMTTNCKGVILRTYIIKSTDGKEYVGMTPTECSITTAEPLSSFKTYVFSVSDGGSYATIPTLTPTQAYVHDAKPREMFPLNKDWTRVMVITDAYISFLIFDETTKTYAEANRFSVPAVAVGIDELDRIWVTDTSDKVSLLTPFIPTRVNITYELANYNYTGTNINSYIRTGAYDAFSARIATSITLTIDGPNCTFADGSKSKVITTSLTSDVQTPIIVTNSGYFRIIANTQV